MKFNPLPLLLAGATFVAAVPLRVIMVISHVEQANPEFATRIGVGNVVHAMSQQKQPCGAGAAAARIHEKAINISNAFRLALGMDRIEAHPTAVTPGFVHLTALPSAIPNPEGHHRHPHHHHDHHHEHHHHKSHPPKTTFMRRIHLALTSLGRWEGRAVAFVLGCGIGVLLRMFFIMGVVLYRSIRVGSSDDEEDVRAAYQIIRLYDDAEELAVPPPHYIVDEKVAVPEDA